MKKTTETGKTVKNNRLGCFLLALWLTLGLAACGPDDFQPEAAGPGNGASSEDGSGAAGEASPESQSASHEAPGESEDSSWYGDNYLLESSPAYSDENGLAQDLAVSTDLDWVWYANPEALGRLAPGAERADAMCRKGVLEFAFSGQEDLGELAEKYGLSREELEIGTMKSWPWDSWETLVREYTLYVGALELEEPPAMDIYWMPDAWDLRRGEEGELSGAGWGPYGEDAQGGSQAPTPTPEPTPEWEPAGEYQPPEFQPVEEHPGFEMAVTEPGPGELPLQVRLRWRREGRWCFAQIPGHSLEAFWSCHEDLLEKRDLAPLREERQKERQEVGGVKSEPEKP